MEAQAVVKGGKVLPFIFRHPWVFRGALESIRGEVEDGQVLQVVGPRGEFLAWGWLNRKSKLVLRLICFEKDFEEEQWLRKRIQKAVEYRENFLKMSRYTNSYRLIHSEGDGIPGLIVDRYGEYLVLQFSCLALERLSNILVDELAKIPGIRGIIRKDDPIMARMEGMECQYTTLYGESIPEEFILEEYGLKYKVRFRKAQKTGFYLDQRENRQLILKYAQNGVQRVLDAFCYTGGFSITMAKHLGGIREILAIDSSEEALKLLEENAQLNQCPPIIRPLQGNVFSHLDQLWGEGYIFDLAVVDPPKFIPNRRSFERGFHGYKKLNRYVFRLIRPGGLVLTCSCSQMMDDHHFVRMLAEAAGEAGREAVILEKRYQPPDHPVNLACPEGGYLKAYLLKIY